VVVTNFTPLLNKVCSHYFINIGQSCSYRLEKSAKELRTIFIFENERFQKKLKSEEAYPKPLFSILFPPLSESRYHKMS
jgi:hypothetical protein